MLRAKLSFAGDAQQTGHCSVTGHDRSSQWVHQASIDEVLLRESACALAGNISSPRHGSFLPGSSWRPHIALSSLNLQGG